VLGAVFIGQREWGRPYCHPIAAHREHGFTALPQRRVSWLVGVAGRAWLPPIMRGRWASGFGRARSKKE